MLSKSGIEGENEKKEENNGFTLAFYNLYVLTFVNKKKYSEFTLIFTLFVPKAISIETKNNETTNQQYK